MLRRVFPLIRSVSQVRSGSTICSRLPPKCIAPALTRGSKKFNWQQSPMAIGGTLDQDFTGIDRKIPSAAEIQAELFEVLCNFKDYKVDRDSVSTLRC